MNSKESFLNALQQGISVLAESEQQDILEEYAQHIEMKMSGGLTEEEAVRDFGDMHQLIAEILEAYHVNPSYASKNSNSPWWASLGRTLQSWACKTAKWAKREVQEMRAGSEQPPEGSQLEGQETCSHPVPKKMGGGFTKLLRAAPRFVWNGVLFLCAIPVVLFGMAGLLLLGIVVVWLSQGMPLVGALLCCVGILLTCVGLLGLGKNLIWHGRRAAWEVLEEKEVMDHVEE